MESHPVPSDSTIKRLSVVGAPRVGLAPAADSFAEAVAASNVAGPTVVVACQGDGTTSLSRAWDHLGVSVSITGLALGVNGGAPGGAASLPVGGAFDDQGVCA